MISKQIAATRTHGDLDLPEVGRLVRPDRRLGAHRLGRRAINLDQDLAQRIRWGRPLWLGGEGAERRRALLAEAYLTKGTWASPASAMSSTTGGPTWACEVPENSRAACCMGWSRRRDSKES